MTPLMIAIVIAAAVGALVYVVASTSIEKADVRDSLRRLEGYQIQDVRDQEMLAPMSERVVAPLLDGLSGVATRFTPKGYGEKVAQKGSRLRGAPIGNQTLCVLERVAVSWQSCTCRCSGPPHRAP